MRIDERSGAHNLRLARSIAREDVMPFTVVFLNGSNKLDSRKCETKTEAVAYAEARQSFQPETNSAIIVDDNDEIVFTTEQAKESDPTRELRRADVIGNPVKVMRILTGEEAEIPRKTMARTRRRRRLARRAVRHGLAF
jgi:hypothetical protein